MPAHVFPLSWETWMTTEARGRPPEDIEAVAPMPTARKTVAVDGALRTIVGGEGTGVGVGVGLGVGVGEGVGVGVGEGVGVGVGVEVGVGVGVGVGT
jgi:hypothetical protein